jgi:uncharacterized protein YcnI
MENDMNIGIRTASALICAALAGPALAHITLEQAEAASGSTYKAVLRVGHGCEGAATTGVRVQIPEGVIAVHPMPKPGWKLETVTGAYAEPVQYYDQTLSEGVQEIAWSGGDLPDEWYDEFVFRAHLPEGEPGQVLYFPIVQECGDAVTRWIETPAEGQDPEELDEPAPSVTLTGAAE